MMAATVPSLFPGLDDARSAVLSPCGRYRYSLTRQWDTRRPTAVFVMLNPSTADADVDDPTVVRCVRFARRFGCGALHVVNLYALRATDPRRLWTVEDPVGPGNDEYLLQAASRAHDSGGPLIAAWGQHAPEERVAAVAGLLGAGVELECLGLTQAGAPRHPLYLPVDAARMPCRIGPLRSGAGGGR